MTDPFRFTAETNIMKALELDPRVKKALQEIGLKCVDRHDEMCVAAEVETLADAARFHEKSLDEILDKLNALQVRPRTGGA